MSTLTLFLVGIGLSMDAFAVSISNGIILDNYNKKMIYLSTIIFGLFQAVMPIIGFSIGNIFISFISKFSGILGFVILSAIGGKSIYDSFKGGDEQSCNITYPLIILQAIATSIDALAVGISYAALNVDIIPASIFIGVITFGVCLVGVLFGNVFGKFFEEKATIFGGLILICIGIKILVESF
ncbi:MAG: manganese efflux pump MntP family protein [Oscillospiraceae bacterium]